MRSWSGKTGESEGTAYVANHKLLHLQTKPAEFTHPKKIRGRKTSGFFSPHRVSFLWVGIAITVVYFSCIRKLISGERESVS